MLCWSGSTTSNCLALSVALCLCTVVHSLPLYIDQFLIYADSIFGRCTELDILFYIEYLIELDINSDSADINKLLKNRLLRHLQLR